MSNNGLSSVGNPTELQSLIVTNRIIAIAIILLAIIGTLLGVRQWNFEPILVLSLSVFFIFLAVLMNQQRFNTARVMLCFSLPIFVLSLSIISKIIPGEEVTDSEFYDYRYVLIAASLVPPLVFGFAQKGWLAISLMPYLLAFIIFDPVHDWVGVGYYQIDHSIPSYQISQWIATIMFLLLVAGVLVMRKTADEIQMKNLVLIRQLNKVNSKLEAQKTDIIRANEKIKTQNEELNVLNSQLTDKVVLTDKELQESNRELVKHNNELQQFSYTISHNLRGPVASILGLVGLLETDDPTQRTTIEHLRKSARSLDSTIRDLGMVMDIRNDIFKIRQRVDIQNLIDEIITPFKREILQRGIRINQQISAKFLYTIKPMFTSIVYNLISNSLKYSDPKKSSAIEITTSESPDAVRLEIKDNGIGMDLDTYGQDIFKLYKRFHLHNEGKGIGLYLVKLQIEALGASIHVESTPGKYTQFTMFFPKADNLDYQILLDEDYAQVYFDASRNMVGINWKRQVTSAEFRLVFTRSQEFMKEYNAVHWFIDTRKRGGVGSDDQLWLVTKLLPDLFKLGLKRLAVVNTGELDTVTHEFYSKNMDVFAKYGIEIFFAKSPADAFAWYEERKIPSYS